MTYCKPFMGCAHGARYTYTITAQTETHVRWVRTDVQSGAVLDGKSTLAEWDLLYVPAGQVWTTRQATETRAASPEEFRASKAQSVRSAHEHTKARRAVVVAMNAHPSVLHDAPKRTRTGRAA